MVRRIVPVLSLISLGLTAQGTDPSARILVAAPEPALLDLAASDPAALVPRDARDAAQVEAARQRWEQVAAPFAAAPAVRVKLPRSGPREALLKAAGQALRVQAPGRPIYLAFDAGAAPIMDEDAWGAVDGGCLLASDLGSDSERWRERLAEAQGTFPGRPWRLWLPADPGALASALLGDGGRLSVPAATTAAALAAQMPMGDVEGGVGDLTVRIPKDGAKRWRFQEGRWVPAPLPKERHEVEVAAADTYDVPGLLAKVRAAQLRSLSAVRTLEGRLDVDLHFQGRQGPGQDLGFSFRHFESAGEGSEDVREGVRFNGVKAKLPDGLELPIVEPQSSLALPVSLALTERYRYSDGGPAGPGRRVLRFAPVDPAPRLNRGELVVDEATGQVLQERRERSGLDGTVKRVREVLDYGEVAPGAWRVVKVQSFEGWVTPQGEAQVQRRIRMQEPAVNAPGFEARRDEARRSEHTIVKQTVEGTRYFRRQPDGTRKVEEKLKASGRAVGGFLLMDPNLKPPVFPAVGLVYFDFNAFDKGIQVNALTALVFNQASITIPHIAGGFDVQASSTALFIAGEERPVKNGRLQDKDAVGHRFANADLGLGRDLPAGFRLEAHGRFVYDRYEEARDDKYRTPNFALPPSGLTREGRLQGSWLFRGFQVSAYHGWGQRPQGNYGTAADPQSVPDEGRFRRWGGALGLDREVAEGLWVHGEAGVAGGRGFDRFEALSLGGLGGDVRIAGIRSNSVAADHLAYAKAGVVVPTGPNLRLTLSLDHARARSLDDQKTYGFTGLGVAGDMPGFWWFTAVRLDLGVGLKSDVSGVRTVNGFVAFLRVF